MTEEPTYVLGHTRRELERLARQAKLIDPMTRRFFEGAGIARGMRVLDVGSGAGDVAFLVSDLVTPSGQVVGVDRSPVALEAARARTAERSLNNVSFVETEPAGLNPDTPFDAAVGRYVLMFQPDPVATLRSVVRHVRPGGVVVFQEPDWTGFRSLPTVPLYQQLGRWIVETIEKNGADSRMGMKLYSTFVAAGLPAPAMAIQSLISGGEDMEAIRHTTEILDTLLEIAERSGVVNRSEVGIETLADRISAEALATRAVLAARSEVGAWCRVP